MPVLDHLILVENQIAEVKALEYLNKATLQLKQLDMMENPIVTEKGDGFKVDLLILQSES